jgi:electron transfer flavoprotein alpha subunit
LTPENTAPGDRQFWCFMESSRDQIRPVSLEILGHAAFLAAREGGIVCAIVISAPLNSAETCTLNSYGADKIYHFTSTILHPDEMVALLCERIIAQKPLVFLMPATSQGRYLAPRIAARLGIGLTGDCVGLEMDSEGMLVQLKPAFGGNIVASIYSRTLPQMATVRPGALESRLPRIGKKIPVLTWPPPKNAHHRFEIVSMEPDLGIEAEKMDDASIIVCVGAGFGQENISLAFRLAELLNGAVGATRKVVDLGWMQRQFQIGLTGRFVSPQAYLGLGVSGRYNHTIGIQKATTIVSINQDPNAEIFKISDLGVVGDCVAITRKMIEHFEHKE